MDFFINVNSIVSALWPIVGIFVGLALGYSVVEMIGRALRGEESRMSIFSPPPTARLLPPPEPIKPLRREPSIDLNLCRYCGRKLRPSDTECPSCSAPRG